ncbi:substrate-binding periplasmic protein [Pseudoalteromonas mariniglutinosa]|uniref:substrate-binding periplasmic protein n=1 Tax=Pseudoalteromonas mariniglutinosa TaxID=206042 RepID=UPI00384D4C9D
MPKYFVIVFVLCTPFSASTMVPINVVTELSPPNQTLINNQVAGHSTELVKAIFKQANLTANIALYPWARAFDMATKKPNTFIYSMARTPAREDDFHWIGAIAYFQLGFVKLAHRTDIRIDNTDDAKQYKIAVQRNDLAALKFTDRGYGLVFTTDISKSYQLLLAGKVDLVIDDPMYIDAMAEQLALDSDTFVFVRGIEELAVEGYLAANINTRPEYLRALHAAFKQIKQQPFYKQVMALEKSNKLTHP